jgi:hypothetical protein
MPVARVKAFSRRMAHALQVMPCTGRSAVCGISAGFEMVLALVLTGWFDQFVIDKFNFYRHRVAIFCQISDKP